MGKGAADMVSVTAGGRVYSVPRSALRIVSARAAPRSVAFDPLALYAAVVARAGELNLSNREVLRQIGVTYPSLITRLGQGKSVDAHSLVALLSWLGETDLAPYIRQQES